jgi:hypothetical protein
MSSYPTDTICWFTVSRAASRSTLRYRRPATSPRRIPVVASRNARSWSPVQTFIDLPLRLIDGGSAMLRKHHGYLVGLREEHRRRPTLAAMLDQPIAG